MSLLHSFSSILSIASSFLTSSSFVSSSSMVTDCMIHSTVTVTRDDCNTFGTKKRQNQVPATINSCTNTAVLILGAFLILSLMINVITLTVCYCKRKGKDNQSMLIYVKVLL